MTDSERNVRVWDYVIRQFGGFSLIPRKVRSIVVQLLAGNQRSNRGRNFEVNIFEKLYQGTTASHIDWHVFYFGVYDPIGTTLLRFIAGQLEKPIFLDIGANSGTHTMAVCDLCSKVHCFEPYPPVLTVLRQHLKENNINNTVVHEVGLSNENAYRSFYADKNGNLGAGSFLQRDREPDCKLPVKRGDTLFAELEIEHSDIIKIDVEGLEANVLVGLSQHLKQARPIVIWEFDRARLSLETLNEIEALFPTDYQGFRVGYRQWWTKTSPKLSPLDSLERGNLVAIPREQIALLKDVIT